MLTIAGGIILAVLFLALLPVIFPIGVVLLLLAAWVVAFIMLPEVTVVATVIAGAWFLITRRNQLREAQKRYLGLIKAPTKFDDQTPKPSE